MAMSRSVTSRTSQALPLREYRGWKPKITFGELVKEMVREDLKSAERNEIVKRQGYYTINHHV